MLVAVSGGADSVALLHALWTRTRGRRGRLVVAHLNHGIRGASAEADARFVRVLARRLGIPCVIGRTDVPVLARRRKLSIEMAAREARYAFLAKTARKVGACAVATAHTADDQAETVLLKLLRGAGPAGLSGIPAETRIDGICVVRPLLRATRRDVLAYLRSRKLDWREDETNRDPRFLRNRVRHELLPLLERDYNPAIRATLGRTAEVLGAEDEWMDLEARKALGRCMSSGKGPALNTEALRDQPLALRRRVLRLWLAQSGVPAERLDFDAVARVDRLARGSRMSCAIDLAGGWEVRRERDTLRAGPARKECSSPFRCRVRVPGTTLIPELGLAIEVSLSSGVAKERDTTPGRLPARASLSAAAWRRRVLWVRSWRPGDRMAPFGLRGSKKVQDILTDAKVPRDERGRIPLFECGGDIVWIPGYRIARDWAVRDRADVALQIAMTNAVL